MWFVSIHAEIPGGYRRNRAVMNIEKDVLVDRTLSRQEFASFGGKKLVYVRAVRAEDVMEQLLEDHEQMDIPAETILYALHSADGSCIALMGNKELAFAAARQNEMMPVSVH